jgi:hypothetical protein
MTSSISSGSRNRRLGAAVVACAVLAIAGVAHADRKRVVVLAFEGPRAEKFHDDVVRLVRKVHTVVPVDRWNGAAAEMNASSVSDRNIKRVANKLKVDAVIAGKIEKRRDDYLIQLKLHHGKSGELVGQPVATKATGPRIDGRAQREIQEELVDVIQSVESMHDGVTIEDDEDERPAKKTARKVDERDEDDRPAKKTAKKADDEDDEPANKTAKKDGDEEERPARRGFGRLSDEDRGADRVDRAQEDDEEDRPRARKKIAARPEAEAEAEAETEADADADEDSLDGEATPSLSGRAVDAVAGLSITRRRMTFAYRSDLATRPPGYRGRPVGGAMLDTTLYPLALGDERSDVWKDVGLHVMYDRVLFINSRDPVTGVDHPTKQSRYSVGAVVRRTLWDSPRAMVVAGFLDYSRQVFSISGPAGLPSVQYTILEPGGALRMPVIPKITVGAEVRLMVVTSAGRIEAPTQYGDTRAIGIEGALAIDYQITRNVFARVALRAETLRLTFEGNGELATMRDDDPMTQDVSGARDSYVGGLLTAGYVY